MKRLIKNPDISSLERLIRKFNCAQLMRKYHLKSKILAEILQRVTGVFIQKEGIPLQEFHFTELYLKECSERNVTVVCVERDVLKINLITYHGEQLHIMSGDEEIHSPTEHEQHSRTIGTIKITDILALGEKMIAGHNNLIINIAA